MMRFALIDSSNTIILFMGGTGLTMADSPMTIAGGRVIEITGDDWNIGDTVTEVSGEVMIGTGIPDNKHGKNGSCYVNVSNGNVYKKQNNTWF